MNRKTQLFSQVIDELINSALLLGDKQNTKTTADQVEIARKIEHKKRFLIDKYETEIQNVKDIKIKKHSQNSKRGKR